MTTDGNSSFDENDMRRLVGYDMARRAAAQVYEQTGVSPDQIGVAELHDCFTTNELITYEVLSFAVKGEAEKFIFHGGNTYGGHIVTNPSGGWLAEGHPLAATGLAQCVELTWQLHGSSYCTAA